MITFFNKEVATPPATVEEAISDLTVALDNLATISADRRAEAVAMHEQARVLTEKGNDATAEADRADRIHDNIAALLK